MSISIIWLPRSRLNMFVCIRFTGMFQLRFDGKYMHAQVRKTILSLLWYHGDTIMESFFPHLIYHSIWSYTKVLNAIRSVNGIYSFGISKVLHAWDSFSESPLKWFNMWNVTNIGRCPNRWAVFEEMSWVAVAGAIVATAAGTQPRPAIVIVTQS